jgi:hypothetical protein
VDPSRLIGPVATRVHMIENFDTFILNNIPYADVAPEHIRWGTVQYDGPDARGVDNSKPALQWHFGGVPYPISKAVRIPYSYVRTWDDSNAIVPASIFLGFQDRLTELVLPQPIPYVAAPSATFLQRQSSLGRYGAVTNPSWASDAAVLASEATGLVTRSYWRDPSAGDTFERFIEEELNLDPGRFAAILANPTPVDFDGLAQDNDSQNVFQYMVGAVVNDPAAYGRLLHWYFGGKAYSLTKVMRVWLDTDYQAGVTQPSFVQQAAQAASAALRVEELQKLASPRGASTRGDPRQARRVPPPRRWPSPIPVPTSPQGRALFIGYGGGISDNG